MAKIEGFVVDSETGDGIINSRIEVVDKMMNILAVTATDEMGEFEVTGIPPGEYEIILKAEVHQPVTLPVQVEDKDEEVRVRLRSRKIILT